MMRIKGLVLASLLASIVLGPLAADERTVPLDIYILLDKSKSMAEDRKFTDARAWLLANIVQPVIIPGDRLFLTAFYGKSTTVWDGPVSSAADKTALARRLAALRPDGPYTDIGSALDVVKAALEKGADDGRKKYVLLVTDDKQEAPPGSPYFSADGKFSHAFLTYKRIEDHGAWKSITLGVGIDGKVSSSVALLQNILSELPRKDQPEGSASAPSALRLVQSALPWALGVLLLLGILVLALLVAKRLKSRGKEAEGENGGTRRP